MAEWLHVQLNYGTSQTGTNVVPEEVIKETHDPVNGYPSSSSYWLRPNIPITLDDSKYALGWRTGFYRGKDNPRGSAYIYSCRQTFEKPSFTFVGEKCCNTTILDPQS